MRASFLLAVVYIALSVGQVFGQLPIPENLLPRIPSIPTVNLPQVPNVPSVPDPLARFAGMEIPEFQNIAPQEEAKPKESLDETVEKLLAEFGPNAKFGVTEHFIYIYDTSEEYASWVALLCERVENVYEHFADYLGVGMTELEDPMIVLLFTNKEDYESYAQKTFSEFPSMKNKPVGFYSSGNNRAASYDRTQTEREKTVDKTKKFDLGEFTKSILAQPDGEGTMTTIVHETAHQVSFNRGLFNRSGQNPSWAVEGLAMLFEAPVGEVKDGGWNVTVDFGPNKRRIREFQEYVKVQQDANPLRKVVSNEKVNPDVPGSYELSWALFSYLYKKHPDRLAHYLYGTAVQKRTSYSINERVEEFELCFTNDWDKLWEEVRAFVDQLEKDPDSFMPQAIKEEEKDGKKTDGKKDEKDASGDKKQSDGKGENAENAETDADGKEVPEKAGNREEKSASNAKVPPVKASAGGNGKKKASEKKEPERRKESPKEESAPKPEIQTETPNPAELPKPAEPPKPAEQPKIEIEGLLLDGGKFDWSRYSGKYALVFFWATWSGDSKAEAAKLTEVYSKYHGAGLEIVGYSLDDDMAPVKDFVAANKIEWPTVAKQGDDAYEDMAERYAIFKVPAAILVGKDGRKIVETGPDGKQVQWLGSELDRKLKELFPDVQ